MALEDVEECQSQTGNIDHYESYDSRPPEDWVILRQCEVEEAD